MKFKVVMQDGEELEFGGVVSSNTTDDIVYLKDSNPTLCFWHQQPTLNTWLKWFSHRIRLLNMPKCSSCSKKFLISEATTRKNFEIS